RFYCAPGCPRSPLRSQTRSAHQTRRDRPRQRPGPRQQGHRGSTGRSRPLAHRRMAAQVRARAQRYRSGLARPQSLSGRGARRVLRAGTDTIGALAALPDGGLLVAAQDPLLEVLESDDMPRWVTLPPKVGMRGSFQTLAASADGTIVDFGFEVSDAQTNSDEMML